MDINYYVLGKKDNNMLFEYLEKYYLQVQEKMLSIGKEGFLEDLIGRITNNPNNKDFIISPDISSLVEAIYMALVQKKKLNLAPIDVYIKKFERQMEIYLSGDLASLTLNQGQKINNTQIRLTPIDDNPFNMMEAHPDHKKSGGMLGWGEKSEADWIEIYSKTFDVLQKTDEGVYDELNMMIKKIVPLGTAKGTHNSCSYRECIGHLYMGYTIDSDVPEINNLEAIIHESSHNKLNLLLHFDPIILTDYQEIYYSPYRPDPRHMHGTYLGLHAFAPTIYIVLGAYLRGLIPPGYWGEKIALYHVKNKLALKVIEKYGKFTPLGYKILDEMKYVMGLTDLRIKELNLSKESLNIIQSNAKNHFSKVVSNYSKVLY